MEHHDQRHEPMPIRSRAPKGGLAGPPTGAERARMWAGLSFIWDDAPRWRYFQPASPALS
jgi:hypothetical protein